MTMKTKNTREYRLYHNITTPEQEMQRLEAIVRNLKQEREKIIAERDEARRMYCEEAFCHRFNELGGEATITDSRQIAHSMGWDCFKDNPTENALTTNKRSV